MVLQIWMPLSKTATDDTVHHVYGMYYDNNKAIDTKALTSKYQTYTMYMYIQIIVVSQSAMGVQLTVTNILYFKPFTSNP